MFAIALLAAQVVVTTGPVTTINQTGGITAGVVGTVDCGRQACVILPSTITAVDSGPKIVACLVKSGAYYRARNGLYNRRLWFKRLPASKRHRIIADCYK